MALKLRHGAWWRALELASRVPRVSVPSSCISEDWQSSPQPHHDHATRVQQATNTHLNAHPPTPFTATFFSTLAQLLLPALPALPAAHCLLSTANAACCLLPAALALLCFALRSTDLPRSRALRFRSRSSHGQERQTRCAPTRCACSVRASAPWRARACAFAHVWVVVHGWWCARASAPWRARACASAWWHGACVWCMGGACEVVHGARVRVAWRVCLVAWRMARVCLVRVLTCVGGSVLGGMAHVRWCMARACLVAWRVCLVHGARVLMHVRVRACADGEPVFPSSPTCKVRIA